MRLKILTFIILMLLSSFSISLNAQDENLTLPFETVPCAYELPESDALIEGETVFCGEVIVPENRDADETNDISLAVTLVQTIDAPQDDPIFFLGEAGVDSAFYLQSLAGLVETGFLDDVNRALVLIDLRGTGASTPSLSCVAEAQAASNTDNNFNAECRVRLESEGIDLSAYNRVEMAADVDAVREALGYETVNLYGHGYGTLLAQEVVRRYPDTVRSVMLEGALSPERPAFVRPLALSSALNTVFEQCANDPICSGAFPAVAQDFQTNYDLAVSGSIPVSNATYINVLYLLLSGAQGEITVPFFIDAVALGNQAGLQESSEFARAEVLPADAVFSAVRALVSCSDVANGATIEMLDEMTAGIMPPVRDVFNVAEQDRFIENCANWDVTALDDGAYSAVMSDVPALFLNGALDPNVSPSESLRVAAGFANSTLVVVDGFGAWVVGRGGACGVDVYAQFLNDPGADLDTSCADEQVVTFRLPIADEATQGTGLEPVEITRGYFSTVVPPDWTEVNEAIFVSGTGQALIGFRAVAGRDIQTTLLEFVGTELPTPELVNELSTGALNWEIYTTSSADTNYALALATDDEQVYIVLVQSLLDNIDSLLELVMTPALEAYQLVEE